MFYICFLSLVAGQANLFVFLHCCGLHLFPFSLSRSRQSICVPVLLWSTFFPFSLGSLSHLFVFLYSCGLHLFPFSPSRSSKPICVLRCCGQHLFSFSLSRSSQSICFPELLWSTFVSLLSKHVKPTYLCSCTVVVYICFISHLAGQANLFEFLHCNGLHLFPYSLSRSCQPICVPALLWSTFVSFFS